MTTPADRPDHMGSTAQPAQPYGPAPSYSAPGAVRGEDPARAAQLSLVFGILSLVLIGIVFGPLAIWQAGKAERAGADATAGKVLGWIGTALGLLGLVLVVVWVLFMMFLVGSLDAGVVEPAAGIALGL